MAIRSRIVDRPIQIETPTPRIAINAGIFEPCARPLRFLLPVGRQREVLVLSRFVLFEGPLRLEHTDHTQGASDERNRGTESHTQERLQSAIRVSRAHPSGVTTDLKHTRQLVPLR